MATNNSSLKLETPKNRNIRYLGLKRPNRAKVCCVTPDNIPITPQSDGKIRDLLTTHTNILSYASKQLIMQPLSANACRPHNLALSKKIREKVTKKRLQFHPLQASGLIKKEDEYMAEGATNNVQADGMDYKDHKDDILPFVGEEYKEEGCTKNELTKFELEQCEKHIKRVKDLKEAIEKWRLGFCNALDDLHGKFQHLTKEQILQQLHIDRNILQYIED